MQFNLAAAKRLRQEINEVAVILGPPIRRSMWRARGATLVRCATWDCGCVVDYIDHFPDDRQAGLHWDACGEHRQASAGRQASMGAAASG
jgi:hypothetical protein